MMAKFNIEDIVAYYLGSQLLGDDLVCPKCLDSTEERELTANQIRVREDVDKGEVWFCDRCGERIL